MEINSTTLKCLRLYTGLSIREFAQEIGVGIGTVSECSNSVRPVSEKLRAKVLIKFGDVLDDKTFLAFMSKFI